jgi:hypothetical protein
MYPFCVPLKGKKIRASRRMVPSPETPDQAAKHPSAKVHTQLTSTKGGGGVMTEERHPDVAAQMISDLAEGGRIDQVITASGLPPATARALLKRLRTQHLPVQLEIKRNYSRFRLRRIFGRAVSGIDIIRSRRNNSGPLGGVFGIIGQADPYLAPSLGGPPKLEEE